MLILRNNDSKSNYPKLTQLGPGSLLARTWVIVDAVKAIAAS